MHIIYAYKYIYVKVVVYECLCFCFVFILICFRTDILTVAIALVSIALDTFDS